MELKGKKAIITGISKGIGRACTEKLLEKGVSVTGWGQSAPPFSHEHLQFIRADVRRNNSVEAAFKETMEHFGNSVDILINNAGLGYFGPLEELSLDQYHQMIETNINGVFYVSRNVIPVMKKQQSGHIINLSSIAGLETNKQVAVYSATKHAVTAITNGLFRDLRNDNIKVTGIYPGSVRTNFFDNAPGLDAHEYMMKPGEIADSIIHCLESPSNYLVNQVVMRPLQPKGPNK